VLRSGLSCGRPRSTSSTTSPFRARFRLCGRAESEHKAWPAEFRGRTLHNAFTAQWHEHEDAITPDAEQLFREAKARRDYDVANLYAGQPVGLVSRVENAGDIVRRIADDAEQRLAAVAELIEDDP